MRTKVRVWAVVALAAAVLGVTLSLAACGGHSLKGTTWKGDLIGKEVTLTFVTGDQCQMGVGSTGVLGTYLVSKDVVSVRVLKGTFDFTIDGDTMTGRAYGVGLTLTKQK
jgi:hypothetical protein